MHAAINIVIILSFLSASSSLPGVYGAPSSSSSIIDNTYKPHFANDIAHTQAHVHTRSPPPREVHAVSTGNLSNAISKVGNQSETAINAAKQNITRLTTELLNAISTASMNSTDIVTNITSKDGAKTRVVVVVVDVEQQAVTVVETVGKD